MDASRAPYDGKKLVLAFRIGTAFSSVSYSVLNPGEIPTVQAVTRFPGQVSGDGDVNVPNILYYDQAGDVRAVGAGALLESVVESVEDEGWVKAEWFNLYIDPKPISESAGLPPLPCNKTVEQVFADFLMYLYTSAKEFIEGRHIDGVSLWKLLEDDIEYLFTHSNDWKEHQQRRIRQAFAQAGLAPNTSLGRGRITFVTQGAASLHYFLQEELGFNHMKNGDAAVVVDTGEGTINISTYGHLSETSYEEIAAPQRYHEGSLFVTARAHAFFHEFLKESKFSEDVPVITAQFNKRVMPSFQGRTERVCIRFGGVRDRDMDFNIRHGTLQLNGDDVAKFFQPAVDCIVDAILRSHASKRITSAFIVGAFSNNNYLFKQVESALMHFGIGVFRSDTGRGERGASFGTISFYLDRFRETRYTRDSCGSEASPDANDSPVQKPPTSSNPTANINIADCDINAGGNININVTMNVFNIIYDPALLARMRGT